MIRRGYDSDDNDDNDFATAVAASAHAIHSLEEALSELRIKRANTRKQEPYRPPQTGSIRKPSIQDTRTNSSFMRPRPPLAEDQRQKKQPSTSLDAKVDAWEKAQIAKIRKRYEKIESQIAAWGNEKRRREKREMERKKGELELKKSRNMKHYQSKVGRIDNVAGGARARVEEKRKHEESIVKDKARKMRSTGKAPVNCFCF